MNSIYGIVERNKQGRQAGVYSVCCAQPLVLEAAMMQALQDGTQVLIEATANQVNQYGGYTGMKPLDYVSFVRDIALKVGLPMDRVILGGDHLGPVCWTGENATQAMEKAKALIAEYVTAGFQKIHLDTSMPCADDGAELADAVVAERAAELCKVAEDTAQQCFASSDIVYVVGTEVPPPGGATEEIDSLELTPVSRVEQTLVLHRDAFKRHGVESAWQRVVAIVVQPGVEFDHTAIIDYQSDKAQQLKDYIASVDNLVYEAHSTDYQLPQAYQQLVKDHFAILKVGPQLTFAMREALFALSYIEESVIAKEHRSQLREVFETVMLDNPNYWQKFYQVATEQQQLYRQFSYSDRIRYYWNTEQVEAAVERLLNNLSQQPIPLPLLSQFLPEQYQLVRKGALANDPKSLVLNKIQQVTSVYASACSE